MYFPDNDTILMGYSIKKRSAKVTIDLVISNDGHVWSMSFHANIATG